jgi:hypothetical protein
MRHIQVGNGFKPFPTEDFGRLASACLREAASAKAGAFLSSPTKMIFSANC